MTDTTTTLSDLQLDVTMLTSMLEGISVLQDQADGPEECPMAKRARNSLPAMLDNVIESGWALANKIDGMDRHQRLEALA